MSQEKPDIGILYIKNTFEPYELDAIITELKPYGLKLIARERSPYINASIDFLFHFSRFLFLRR